MTEQATTIKEKLLRPKVLEIAKYLLVIGVIVFISFLFPDDIKFKYEFDRGQTWHYSDLIAPFDFAIQKSEGDINLELTELEEDYFLYFEHDADIARQQKKGFSAAFKSQLESVKVDGQFEDVLLNSNIYYDYGIRFIDRIYDQGVIGAEEKLLDKNDSFVIKVRRGNTTSGQTLGNILNPDKIENWISDSLFNSGLNEAEFLIPLLKDVFIPNLFYNKELTDKFYQQQVGGISTTRGMVRKGELIVTSNSVVTDDIYQKLVSYREQYQREITNNNSFLGVFLGYFLLTSLIIGVYLAYLKYHAKDVFASFKKMLFALSWLVIYSYLVYAVDGNENLSLYLIPFCIVPIVVKIFYNERLALFTHIVVVLIASFLSSLGYEFTFLQILAGIVAVLSNIKVRDWSQFFFSMLYIFLAYAIAYLGLSLIGEGNLATIDWSFYTWIFLNVFLTLLAYPLVPLLERLFGFTSAITLVELSDMDRPLLKELSIKAPGTLQHSLQVANLAEAAAAKIGANQLLVKVAALYHDIGKIGKPTYFIENQTGHNPHDKTSDLESAKIIIEHVSEGVAMAQKNRLPELLINFIRTHHGTTRVEYFYRNHINKNPGGEVDEHAFRYPGPRPRSKEETILMLADSIEAAAKSLKNPKEKDIQNLVDKIISGKITHGQLEDSEMTFEELEASKKEFKKLLKSIYHVRIEYPEAKK